ncbi:MAG TPA: hypothetical protein DDW78_10900 [Treponema sp.]|nr:hypothetical protein [Treponema sp.]
METSKKPLLPRKQNPSIRELTLKNGLSFPSDAELVMLMLGSGSPDVPIGVLSQKIINVLNGSPSEELVGRLKEIKGIGDSKALAVAAAVELGRRRNAHFRARIRTPADIVPYLKHFALEVKEHFICASMNGAHEVLNIRVASIGTTNRTLIHPREIFAEPLAEHASAVICCHNHPSGPCEPSQEDKDSTRALQEAACILGITFLDHIIITKESYFSFLEHGLL